jgi:GDP-mannose 6-dehydrogenase
MKIVQPNPPQPATSPQKISIFGLGYVGTVSAACLAKLGHQVIGVEVIQEKVDAINRGQIAFIEPGLEALVREVVEEGRLTATNDVAEAIAKTDVTFVSVGTPSASTGMPNYNYLFDVCEAIGNELQDKDTCHDIVIRSTVLPGTAEECAKIIGATSMKREGEGFRVLVNPELLREGTALHDFWTPPFTVIGSEDEHGASRVASLYASLSAPLYIVPRRESEILKFSCNLFHALKIVFGNEIGRVCQAAGVDSHVVMDIFCQDNKLNLSSYYLKPGFAFGGSCLPKDLRAILGFAREHHVSLPTLSRVLESNREQIELGMQMIEEQGKRKIGLFGFSFKPTTDDLRESPLVILAELLIGKGYEVRIFDRQVILSNLLGANKGFLESHLPHAAKLITDDMQSVLDWAQCLVIGNKVAECDAIFEKATADQVIVDLVRPTAQIKTDARYVGIGWQLKSATKDCNVSHRESELAST